MIKISRRGAVLGGLLAVGFIIQQAALGSDTCLFAQCEPWGGTPLCNGQKMWSYGVFCCDKNNTWLLGNSSINMEKRCRPGNQCDANGIVYNAEGHRCASLHDVCSTIPKGQVQIRHGNVVVDPYGVKVCQ